MIVNPIQRRPTRKIRVGSVYVGGDAPISIQSMTNTETCDVAATVAQIQRCVDVVLISCVCLYRVWKLQLHLVKFVNK